MKYNYIQRILSYYYRRVGRIIAKNAIYFLIISIALSLILSAGMIAVNVERAPDYLYSVSNGDAVRSKRIVEELFPMNFSTNTDPLRLANLDSVVFLVTTPHDGGDMLRKEYLEEISTIDKYVRSLQIKLNGSVFNYSSICAKHNGECYKNPISLYKGSDLTKEGARIKYPIEVDSLTYVFIPYVINFGGVVTDKNSNVEMVKAIRTLYILDFSRSELHSMITEWQNVFIKQMLNWQSDLVRVQVSAQTAVKDEFSRFTTQLIPFVGIAALVIMIFSMVTSNTNNWIRSKPWLGVSACFSATFALGSSFGVVIICGVSYVDINIALPFLVLGMGVDDAYVLVAAWRRTKTEWSVEKRMDETYSEAAVSISITSLTNFLSFCVGMLTPYPVMQHFCLYAAVSVVFTFLYLVFFFGACLALSGYREKSEFHPLTCRTIAKSKPNLGENANGDFLMAFFRDKFATLLTFLSFKTVVIAAYFINLSAGLWSLQFLSTDMEMSDVFSSDSFVADAVHNHYKYFTQYPYTIHIVIKETLNYADPKIQKQLDELFVRLENSPQIGDERTRLSWLKYYLSFQKNPFGKFLLRGYNTSDKQEFIDGLSEVFLNIQLAKQFQQDIVFNDNYTEITASRFVLLAKDLNSVAAEQKMYSYVKEVVSTSKIPIIAYSMLFSVFEQTSTILAVVIQLGWVTTLLIAVLFFMFIPSVRCAICVSLAVISSMIETIGYMALWGVRLDVLSMITLTLSAGFSINYPTHVSFSFMMDKSAQTNDRMRKCLYAVGLPIVQGAFTNILAVAPLLYKRAYILDSCFKIIFLITLNTSFHAIFVIPVVLSIIEKSTHPKLSHRLTEKGSLEEKEECIEKPDSMSRTQSFVMDVHSSDIVHFFKNS